MKQITLLLICFLSVYTLPFTTCGQGTDTLPVYKQFPFVPAFQLLKADSSKFYMKEAIPKNKAAVVIIFSPGCSHCQHQAQEITSHSQALADVQFLLVTAYPLPEMKQFINDYGLEKFANIQVGQDAGRNLGNFYKIKGLPGIFVYNKKGNLVMEFTTNASAEAIAKAVKMK